jgi:protein SCO1/2
MGATSSSPGGPSPARHLGIRVVLPIAAILLVLGALSALLVHGSSKPALPGNAATARSPLLYGVAVSPPQAAPPLNTLRNYDGSSFDLAGDRGKVVFVTFLYSHCPDVCPLIASSLHDTVARLPSALRRRVAVVAVSVDPRGDTPGAVAAFVREHQLTGEARYLIGSASALARVWEAWKVGSQRDTSNPELVNHSALVYGVSARGKLTTIYAAGFEPSQLIHDVPALLAR